MYEQYINASARDMTKWILANNNLFAYNPDTAPYQVSLERWCDTGIPNSLPIETIWNRLIAFYQAASPLTYDIVTHRSFTENDKHNHIKSIVESGIFLYIPPDSLHLNKDIFRNIAKVITPTYSQIEYTDLLGRRIKTLDKAFVGIEQMIVLEKTEQNPMAVSTSPLQIHGLPAGPNKIARNGHPSKVQAPKAYSETEIRLYFSTMGEVITADMLTTNNSPEAHKSLVKAIMESDTPTNMNPILKIIRSASRPVVFVKTVLFNFGLLMVTAVKKVKGIFRG